MKPPPASAPSTVQALWKVTKVVLDTLDFNEITQKICDSLLSELGYLNLGYRIIVLSLYQPDGNGLRRISLSQTPEAAASTSASTIPFHNILIPVTATNNLCVKAFLDQKEYITHDWKDLLCPPMATEDARNNQRAAGIKTSMVFPIIVRGKSVGSIIFSLIKNEAEISPSELDLIRGFTDIVGIAVQNAKLYSDLSKTSLNLDAANKKLELLDKLKDEFVSVASHELRTPMTAIKSYTWLVLNNQAGDINPKAKTYIDRVYQSTERLIHLVNEMLDVSRIESGRVRLKIEPVDLAKLASTVQDEFKARTAENKLTLDVQITGTLPSISTDGEKVHQILENLIGNSFKYTPPGGRITITLKRSWEFIEISITDTGRGISAEDLPRLFRKFGLLENSLVSLGSSTGLGLFICKQYTELLGGQIGAKSELGKGSTFTFTLPVAKLQNIN